jgi:hypothetical protein
MSASSQATSLLGLVPNLDQGCLVEDNVMLVQGLDQLLHMVRPAGTHETNICTGCGAQAYILAARLEIHFHIKSHAHITPQCVKLNRAAGQMQHPTEPAGSHCLQAGGSSWPAGRDIGVHRICDKLSNGQYSRL